MLIHMPTRKPRQQELTFRTWGGARKGAGPEADHRVGAAARGAAGARWSDAGASDASDFALRAEPPDRAVHARPPARVSRGAGAGRVSVGPVCGAAGPSPFDRRGLGQAGAVDGDAGALDPNRAAVEWDAWAEGARVRGAVSRAAAQDAARDAECARVRVASGASARGEGARRAVDAGASIRARRRRSSTGSVAEASSRAGPWEGTVVAARMWLLTTGLAAVRGD